MTSRCVPVRGEEYKDSRAVIPLVWVVTAVDEREQFPGCDVPGVVRVCVAEDGPPHSVALWRWRELVLSGQLVRLNLATGNELVPAVSYCRTLYPVVSPGELSIEPSGACRVIADRGRLSVWFDYDDARSARVEFTFAESIGLAATLVKQSVEPCLACCALLKRALLGE